MKLKVASKNKAKHLVTMTVRSLITGALLVSTIACTTVKDANMNEDKKVSGSSSETTVAVKSETTVAAKSGSLSFDKEKYTVKKATVGTKTFEYRAYENILYVANPIDTNFQKLNIYIPVEYFSGLKINNWTAESVPIFLPNAVGGYMPGAPATPGAGMDGKDNAVIVALSRGLVVAAPGARGRSLSASDGTFTGKAPAAIVDLKAAVRFLRKIDAELPGNTERIVSNGTSAGGALSSLLGSSGNVAAYKPYLDAIGAANERDDIFAVSAYCPITNLENSDTAYEWMFGTLKETASMGMPGGTTRPAGPPPGMDAGARPPLPFGAPASKSGPLSAQQLEWSAELAKAFPAYVNSLSLKDSTGKALTLNADGTGSFRTYVESLVLASAQKALSAGTSMSDKPWVKVTNGKVIAIDWALFVAYCGRKKGAPSFDAVDLTSGENDLFGTKTRASSHFTAWAQAKDKTGVSIDAEIVSLMNAFVWVGSTEAQNAKYWRIRHGTKDSDTALAISAILATRLQNTGKTVDYAAPWDVPHSGDYDLNELFTWIETICL